jgi:hypothetical protein
MKTTRLFRLLFILVPALYANAYSQNDSLGWSYFPFRTGDMWEYWAVEGPYLDTAQIINVKDSVLADGKIRLRQYNRLISPVRDEFYNDYVIDTANTIVFQPFVTGDPPRSTNVPIYKFNAQQGDQWVVYDYSTVGGQGYEMARVKEIFEGIIFGRSTTFMVMHYFLAQDSTDTSGLDRLGETLAKGFGLVERLHPEGGYDYYIKGAVINGVLYGDTTYLVTSVNDPKYDFPKGFQLFQNYPNPFNPRTTISFNLQGSANVSLIIYDEMGREIRRLIDNERGASGEHKVLWDGKTSSGKSASSGVYYYRIVSGSTSLVRSMILLK